jgi:hypothetical protein
MKLDHVIAIARHAVRQCSGNAGVIPILFFVKTTLFSSIGPRNIASTALMPPLGRRRASVCWIFCGLL